MSAVFLVKLRELEQRIEALERKSLERKLAQPVAETPLAVIPVKRRPGRPRKEPVNG